MIAIVTTSIWGAKKVDNSRLDRCPAEGLTIHHTAGKNARPLIGPLERIRCMYLARAIQRDHINQGWADSGHHFLVTRSGIIMEGRQGSLEAAKHGWVIRGAHASSNKVNRTCWGIESEGTCIKEPMPEKQLLALVELCATLCYWGNVQSQTLHGHRDVKATQCPGDVVYQMLPMLRSMVHHRKWEIMHEQNP